MLLNVTSEINKGTESKQSSNIGSVHSDRTAFLKSSLIRILFAIFVFLR